MRVACLLGARANAWHSEVFAALPAGFEVTVVGTTAGRYRSEEIASPFLALPWENEVGSLLARRLRNLRYRLSHRLTGYEFRLAPPGDRLAPFDLLHTWELFTEWTRLALEEKARRGVPVLVTVWDTLARHYEDDPRRGPVRRRALAEADRFLVVTSRAAAALRLDGVAPERIAAGAPSVDPERFRPGSARERRGARPDDFVVLTVARLEPAKGVGHLIDGVALARAAAPRLGLWVVGSGAEEAALRERARRLGLAQAVAFLGEVRHAAMPEIYRAADAFVLASVPTADWQEQWGQSLLEAMATGLACVATSSGGVPELLGEAGLLVPPGDPVEIASALVRLAGEGELRAGLGKRARARVEARFTHRDQARRLAALYRGLAATKKDARPEGPAAGDSGPRPRWRPGGADESPLCGRSPASGNALSCVSEDAAHGNS